MLECDFSSSPNPNRNREVREKPPNRPRFRLLMTAAEAAQSLAISQRKLWAMTNCGDIPCVRIGRSVRYDPADLQFWIEEQKSNH